MFSRSFIHVPRFTPQGHARSTPHNPELVLNNFVTRLGHAVGRMFQTLFPPLPEFQGRQVVTLHNQRDFLFFRRHRCAAIQFNLSLSAFTLTYRYAFRSTEKVALQEIGPRFTLKLRWLKKGIPTLQNFGEEPKALDFDVKPTDVEEKTDEGGTEHEVTPKPQKSNTSYPPTQAEFLWVWQVHKF